ncbi:MAG: ADP-ribosylglycohydrolase family protein [Deltaproteobacteria bacterium]
MKKVELILQGISDGDAIGGPFAMASLVAKTLANDPYDFDALDKAYRDYYDSGSFDSGPTFEKVHELMANGYTRSEAVVETHRLFNGSTAGCNPMHRFMVIAGLDVPYERLDSLARRDARMTHHDPIAGTCSSFLIRILRRSLNNEDLVDAQKSVIEETSPMGLNFRKAWPSKNGFAPEVLCAGIKFAHIKGNGLQQAIAYAGTNNYCPVVTGALTAAMQTKVINL